MKKVDTLGYCLNNPLNIRYSPMNSWLGQIGSKKGFCKFDTMEHGFRAALVLLCNYQRKGYDTISKIINHWAPQSENDTETYISYCCSSIGYMLDTAPGSCYDRDLRITDFWHLVALCEAMAYYESHVAAEDYCYDDVVTQYKYPTLKS